MKASITDPVFVENCLNKVIDYNWSSEVTHFEETFETEFQSQWDLEDTIEHIEAIEGGTDHILYSLAVVSLFMKNDEEDED